MHDRPDAGLGPLLELLKGRYLTAAELAARWRYSEDHLSNLRRQRKGPPWVKLPTGAVRYREADIIEFELTGTKGPFTRAEAARIVASVVDVPSHFRTPIIAALTRDVGG